MRQSGGAIWSATRRELGLVYASLQPLSQPLNKNLGRSLHLLGQVRGFCEGLSGTVRVQEQAVWLGPGLGPGFKARE